MYRSKRHLRRPALYSSLAPAASGGQDTPVDGSGGLDDVLSTSWIDAGEILYRNLVEQVPAVVYIETNDEHPRTLYLSPQIETIFGYPRDLLLSRPSVWDDAVHPDDRASLEETWARSIRTGEAFALDYRVVRPDGAIVWTRDSGVAVLDADGKALYWHGVMYDITASKTAEESLRDSEARYRALIENIPAVVYVVAPDDDRKTLYVSPQVEVALGYTRDEWLEQPDIWMELLHPDDREETLAAHDLHNETGRPWSREYRLIASDGRAIWFRDVATLVRDGSGRPLNWQGVQLEITQLKHAEEELRGARDELELRVLERTNELQLANELMTLEIEERRRVERQLRTAQERYRLLAEHLPGVTFVWDIRARRDEPVYVSPQIQSILGYTREEWGRADFWRTRLHPDDRNAVLTETAKAQETGEPFSMEYRYLAKDGRVVWVLEQAILLERDALGNPAVFHGLMLDITARKEAEAKVAEAERRLRTLVEQLPAIVYVELPPDASGSGSLLYLSPQVEAILGYRADELVADPSHLARVVHPGDRSRVLAADRSSDATGEPFDEEYRAVAKDGRVVWLHRRATLVRDEAGTPLYWHGVALDVTRHHELADAMRDLEERFAAGRADRP
jgi:PAS domain S-box-containing protein